MRIRSRDGRVDGHGVPPSRARRGSRALSGFAVSDLPARMHEVLETTIAGHVSAIPPGSRCGSSWQKMRKKDPKRPKRTRGRPEHRDSASSHSGRHRHGACGPGAGVRPVACVCIRDRSPSRVRNRTRRRLAIMVTGFVRPRGTPDTCSGLLAAKQVFRTVRELNTRVVRAAGSGQPGQPRSGQPGRFPGPAADRPIAAASGSRGSGGRRTSPPGCRDRR